MGNLSTIQQVYGSVQDLESNVKLDRSIINSIKGSISALSKAGTALGLFAVGYEIYSIFANEPDSQTIIMGMVENLDQDVNNLRNRMEELFEDSELDEKLTARKTDFRNARIELINLNKKIQLYSEAVDLTKCLENLASPEGKSVALLAAAQNTIRYYNNEVEKEEDKLTVGDIDDLNMVKQKVVNAKGAFIMHMEGKMIELEDAFHNLVDLTTSSDSDFNMFDILYKKHKGNLTEIVNFGSQATKGMLEIILAFSIYGNLTKGPVDELPYTTYRDYVTEFFEPDLEKVARSYENYIDKCLNEVGVGKEGTGNIRNLAEEILKTTNIVAADYATGAKEVTNRLKQNFSWLDFTVIIYDGYGKDNSKNYTTFKHYFKTGSIGSSAGMTLFRGFNNTANGTLEGDIHVLIRWIDTESVPDFLDTQDKRFEDMSSGFLTGLTNLNKAVEQNGNKPIDLLPVFGLEKGLAHSFKDLLDKAPKSDPFYPTLSLLNNSCWWIIWDDQENNIGIASSLAIQTISGRSYKNPQYFSGSMESEENKPSLPGRVKKDIPRMLYMEPGFVNNGNAKKNLLRQVQYFYNELLGYAWVIMA